MSHRLVGTNRYAKNATGGCDGDAGADHVEVTNFKQPPPYLKGKVKSISDTDLGKSMRHPTLSPRVDNSDFAPNRTRKLPPNPTSDTPPRNDTHQQPSSQDYAKLVLEKQHRNKQAIIGRHKKNNDTGIGPGNKAR